MKPIQQHSLTTLGSLAAAALSLQPSTAGAGDGAPGPIAPPAPLEQPADLWTSARPDGHAPIGVMADHTHHAGEWMLSYRYMFMRMDGNRSGTDSLSTHDVFGLGYSVAPLEMDMHMNMVGVMFAPADWLTLGLMSSYNFKDMTLMSAPPVHGHGHGHGHAEAHGHGGHSGTFGHSSEGWGDTVLNALVPLFNAHRQAAHLGLGLGFPTASVEEKDGGVFVPYGMQLGRGLWDFRPSFTYLGQTDRLSWGAQASGVIALESSNDAGFAPGDVFNATGWTAFRASRWASFSGRVNYTYQDSWSGHYNGAHAHAAPPHLIGNYGGEILELGAGLNLYVGQGRLAGHRLAVEALWPVYQDANGVQMERDYSVTLGWQWAF